MLSRRDFIKSLSALGISPNLPKALEQIPEPKKIINKGFADIVYLQDASALLLHNPDENGFYRGLQGTKEYPIYKIFAKPNGIELNGDLSKPKAMRLSFLTFNDIGERNIESLKSKRIPYHIQFSDGDIIYTFFQCYFDGDYVTVLPDQTKPRSQAFASLAKM